MTFKSKIDANITEEYLLTAKESLYFERKSIKTKRSKLADEIIGMLNADGGVVVFGIEDDGTVSTDKCEFTEKETNAYEKICMELIEPMPRVKIEHGKIQDRPIILYHVLENNESIFTRKSSNQVFKRVGDSNCGPLNMAAIQNLQYDKNLRKFEEQFVEDFDENDIDRHLLDEYKKRINFDGSYNDLLANRNLAKKTKDGIKYRNSAILLFSNDPEKYIPSSYIRYVRYDGEYEGVGAQFNVKKDEVIRGNIPTVIRKTKEYLKVAFSEYHYLDTATGMFKLIPEYPEDAWLEGVVNAVFHRSYNLQGNCIMIKHFDNRLIISNSGPLPAQVNVNNIKEQRFSRNPRIGRVLYEMGFVRELNEGVKRIFTSMNEYKLGDPCYSDENDIVTLTLKNLSYGNSKTMDRETLKRIAEKYSSMSPAKQDIINLLLYRGSLTLEELELGSRFKLRAIRANLKELMDEGLVVKKSTKQRDKNARYEIYKK